MRTTKLILTTLVLLGLSSCSIFKKTEHIIVDCNAYVLNAIRYTDSASKYFNLYQQVKDPGNLVKSIMYGDSAAISATNFIGCTKDTSAMLNAQLGLSATNRTTDMERTMYISRFGRSIDKPKQLKK